MATHNIHLQVLNKDKSIKHDRPGCACWNTIKYENLDKGEAGWRYKVRAEKYLNDWEKNSIRFLSDMKELGFFINQSPETIIKDGYDFMYDDWLNPETKKQPGWYVGLFAGTLVRMCQEFGGTIAKYLTIQDRYPEMPNIQVLQLAHYVGIAPDKKYGTWNYAVENSNHALASPRWHGIGYYMTEQQMLERVYKDKGVFYAFTDSDHDLSAECRDLSATYCNWGVVDKFHERLCRGKT